MRKALIDSLNGLLADYFTLYLKTKNFHWHVFRPALPRSAPAFDEQSAEIFALTDIIAERVRKNGGATLTSIGAIAGKPRSRMTTAPRSTP
jgi:starvation-inducible DNA-binding protein